MENRIVEMWEKRESGISSLSAISAHLRITVQHIAIGVFGFCLCFFLAMLRSRSVSAGGSDFYQVILFLVSFFFSFLFFSFLIVIMGGALVFF